MSAISMMPALMACTSSPMPGTSTTTVICATEVMATSSCPTPTVSMMTYSMPAASMRRARSAVARASPPMVPRVAMERMKMPGSAWCCCMRMRSPRMAPPEMRLLGSTARMAMVLPRWRNCQARASTSVLLPAPGGPVMPTMRAWPVKGWSSPRVSKASGSRFSIPVARRASARASPSRIFRASWVVLRNCRAIRTGVYSKSTRAALDDLFLDGIPPHGALLPVASHRHAAGDGNAEADFKRAVGLRAAADGVAKVLHVGLGIAACDAGHLIAVFSIDLLGVILDGLRGVRDGAVIAQRVFGDAQLVIAEAGVPGVKQFFFMLHADVHGVGHFAAILPKVDAAHHGDGAGNLEIHHLVPEGKLVAHVLVHVAAGVVPEEAPVDVAVGVEIHRSGVAQEALPEDVFGRHIGIDRPRPLRFAVRRIAVHVAVDRGDLAHQFRLVEIDGVPHGAGRGPLMADLHGMLAGVLLESRAHAFGVVHRERHGLFLVDMLATGEGGGEMLAVEVLRGSDQDGVDILVVQQAAIVQVGLGGRRDLFDIFQAAGIDVGGADALHVFAGERLLQDFGAARARTDDAQADTLVRAEGIAGRQRAGQTGSDMADEITARLHGKRTPWMSPQLYTLRVRG